MTISIDELQVLFSHLKELLIDKAYRMYHTTQGEGNVKLFVGTIYNPFAPTELFYEIEASHDIVSKAVEIQTRGVAVSSFSFVVRHKKQGISLLVQYFELLDYDFIEALFYALMECDATTRQIWRQLDEEEQETVVHYIKDNLLSIGLPELDMPSLMIEEMLQDVGVL